MVVGPVGLVVEVSGSQTNSVGFFKTE